MLARAQQWRIQDFPEEGALTPKGGAPTYYLAIFSLKLHENEEIWGQRGGARMRAPPAPPPPRSATAHYQFFHKRCSFVSHKCFPPCRIVLFLARGRAVCARSSGKRENFCKTSTPLLSYFKNSKSR